MKKITSGTDSSGNHMNFPQEKGFNPTFWANGWGQKEETVAPGKMEKGLDHSKSFGTMKVRKGG